MLLMVKNNQKDAGMTDAFGGSDKDAFGASDGDAFRQK
ncbi:hypothetical protein [Citrobacter freundii]|uniref:Uncharacterized protein n=1 Tax=Citrobacter freundii TaxID=546 RepID=A0A7G2IIX8_CITFR|nr:hypothetical protein [Citrobacter freundii]